MHRHLKSFLVAALLLPACLATAVATAAERDAEPGGGRSIGRDSGTEGEGERERAYHSEARAEEAVQRDVDRDFEPDEVLAINLSREGWIRARAMGFRKLDEERLAGLGFTLTELSTPGGITTALALRRLRDADPAGSYDVNPRYATAADAGSGAATRPADDPCAGIRCDAQRQVDWPLRGCASELRLGVLDTAVAEGSPALAGRPIRQRHFGETHVSHQGSEHGTAVATVLVGQAAAGVSGLVPRAQLLAADVFDYDGGHPTSTNALLIARGLDWLVAQSPIAINVSLAGPDNAVLHEAIRRVTSLGVPVVAAAGNLGAAGTPRFPAAYPEAIAVTAVDRGGELYEHANRGDYVDVAAPGVQVWSADAEGRGRFFDGTSFATPFVTAEVALRRAADPLRTPQELKRDLRDPARAGPLAVGSQTPVRVLRSHGCPPALTGTVAAGAG